MPTSPSPACPPQASGTEVLWTVLARVRRRFFLSRLVAVASGALLLAAAAFGALLVLERSLALGWEPRTLLVVAAGGALGLSLVRSLAAVRLRAGALARMADARLGLKERLATAVHLAESSDPRLRSEWTRAVCHDSIRAIAARDLRRAFPLGAPRTFWWGLATAALAALVWAGMPALDLLGLREERESAAALRREVDAARRELVTKLSRLAAEAEAKQLSEVSRLLESLGAEPVATRRDPSGAEERRAPAARGESAKMRALADIGQLEEELDAALGSERFRESGRALEALRRLGPAEAGRASSLRAALERGDLAAALEELERIEAAMGPGGNAGEGSRPGSAAEGAARAEDLRELAKDLGAGSRLERSLAAASRAFAERSGNAARREIRAAKGELERLARDLAARRALEDARELLREGRQELARLEKDRCASCGKPRARPGARPGGT